MLLCPDDIIWPDGEDALPADAQDFITRLLRQNPLERLGTGWWQWNSTMTRPSRKKPAEFKVALHWDLLWAKRRHKQIFLCHLVFLEPALLWDIRSHMEKYNV